MIMNSYLTDILKITLKIISVKLTKTEINIYAFISINGKFFCDLV